MYTCLGGVKVLPIIVANISRDIALHQQRFKNKVKIYLLLQRFYFDIITLVKECIQITNVQNKQFYTFNTN